MDELALREGWDRVSSALVDAEEAYSEWVRDNITKGHPVYCSLYNFVSGRSDLRQCEIVYINYKDDPIHAKIVDIETREEHYVTVEELLSGLTLKLNGVEIANVRKPEKEQDEQDE